jgi:hypothetical protein
MSHGLKQPKKRQEMYKGGQIRPTATIGEANSDALTRGATEAKKN